MFELPITQALGQRHAAHNKGSVAMLSRCARCSSNALSTGGNGSGIVPVAWCKSTAAGSARSARQFEWVRMQCEWQ